MDKVKIFLEDGVETEVNCIFYLYNSKYYFLYTLNEIDETMPNSPIDDNEINIELI